jgi:hypothetical protein
MQRITFNGQELYERRFNTGTDLAGKPHNVTIAKIDKAEVRPNGQPETKPIIEFKEAKRPFILNIEFAESIAAALGEYEVTNWIGKRITIYPVPVKGKGDTILARKIETKPQTKIND